MKLEVPFYSNTIDNTHCYQAALKMVLKYFLPKKNFSWEELERITSKRLNLWTWSTSAMVWMQENGFEVLSVDMFDWKRFSKDGENYLIKEYGEEVGNAQIKNSDINQEMKLAKILIKKVDIKREIPAWKDIKDLLKKGYMPICNVNSKALNKKEGYSGHAIVITGFDKEGFFIHDPGLLPRKNRKVSYETFEKAWAYPNKKAKNIEAYRLKRVD